MSARPEHIARSLLAMLLVARLLTGSTARAQDAVDKTPVAEPSAAGPDAGDVSSSTPAQAPQTAIGAEEEPSDQETPYWRTNFFSRFFKDQAYLFKTWIPSEARNPAFSIPFVTITALAYSSSRDEDGGPDAQLEQDISENSRGQS